MACSAVSNRNKLKVQTCKTKQPKQQNATELQLQSRLNYWITIVQAIGIDDEGGPACIHSSSRWWNHARYYSTPYQANRVNSCWIELRRWPVLWQHPSTDAVLSRPSSSCCYIVTATLSRVSMQIAKRLLHLRFSLVPPLKFRALRDLFSRIKL